VKTIETTQLIVLATLAEMQLFESAAITYAKALQHHAAEPHERNALVEYAVHEQGRAVETFRVTCLTCQETVTVTRAELEPTLAAAGEHVQAAWETVKRILRRCQECDGTCAPGVCERLRECIEGES